MTSTATGKDAHGLRNLSANCGIFYTLLSFGSIAIRVCTTQTMPSTLSTVWNIFALLLCRNCLLVLAFFRTCTALISPPKPPLSCCPNQFIFSNAGYLLFILVLPLANNFNPMLHRTPFLVMYDYGAGLASLARLMLLRECSAPICCFSLQPGWERPADRCLLYFTT